MYRTQLLKRFCEDVYSYENHSGWHFGVVTMDDTDADLARRYIAGKTQPIFGHVSCALSTFVLPYISPLFEKP